jgi:MoaA/NifB/PqqE/SkfB family radical SAM enzyme
MARYKDPEPNSFHALCRCYVATKAGGIVPPAIMDIHPISGKCNLSCHWCIGKKNRETIEPLPKVLDKDSIIFALSKVLEPRWRPLWPNEFHFCGSDSEPLLFDEDIIPAIRFLLQRKRIVELVTNGLLLNNDELLKIVARINKLHISLDVTNDKDYRLYKLPKNLKDSYPEPYNDVLNNIRVISEYRAKFKSNLKIKVSFVATPKTFNREKWFNSIKEIKDAGVDSIRVRRDLTNRYGQVEDLKIIVKDAKDAFHDIRIRYQAENVTFSKCNFEYCRGPRMWPTLASDGGLYPCAHTANSEFEPFANLMASDSLMNIYQSLFYPPSKNHIKVKEIGCDRDCPPIIGSFNDSNSAIGNLKNPIFV